MIFIQYKWVTGKRNKFQCYEYSGSSVCIFNKSYIIISQLLTNDIFPKLFLMFLMTELISQVLKFNGKVHVSHPSRPLPSSLAAPRL